MSGDHALGLKGMLRVKGVAGVFLATARVWMKDESKDLAATMKMLDQRMSQAEEWGVSFESLMRDVRRVMQMIWRVRGSRSRKFQAR